MAHDAFLLEDGTGKWLLEDGTGVLLLEQQEDEGVHFINTIAHQKADPYLPSKEKNIEVFFTFQILANTITRIRIRLSEFTQSIPKLDTTKLRDAFIIYSIYEKIIPLFKKVYVKSVKEALGEELLNQLESNPLKFVRDVLRWKKRQH